MAKTIGFKMLAIEDLKSVHDHMASEGTCCLAYGDFIDLHAKMLLGDKQELIDIRQSSPDNKDTHEQWSRLDEEIVEALIMLRASVNVWSESLYWCSECHTINVEYFECDCKHDSQFGFDFSDM